MESPKGTIRNILGGVIFRERSSARTFRATFPAGRSRSSSAVTPSATSTRQPTSVPRKGTITIKFVGEDGQVIEKEVFKAPGAGVTMAMYNLDDSIRDFARASMNYGLMRKWPVLPLHEDTILKAMTAASRHLRRSLPERVQGRVRQGGIIYEHRLIDDMVASALKWSGGYVWACKNYDGDVQSDTVAQGFGSLGLMTSFSSRPMAARSKPKPPTVR